MDTWKNERKELFERVIDNIEGIADIQLYKEKECKPENLIEIGAGFAEGDFVVTDIKNNYIAIYENNSEVLKIKEDSNILVMLNELLKKE